MKRRNLVYTLILVIGISVSGYAQQTSDKGSPQPYQKGIGLRFSPNNYYDIMSLSYKFFVSEAGAIELNGGVGTRRYGGWYDNNGVYHDDLHPVSLSFTGSYQHHFAIPVKGGGFSWFIGGGMTIYRVFSDEGDYDGFGFGIFPTGGVDYKIPNIPLAVSADFRPTLMLTAPDYYNSFYGSNFGLSARYTFGKN